MTALSARRRTGMGVTRLLTAVLLLAVRLAAGLVPMGLDGPVEAAPLDRAAICHAGDATDGHPPSHQPAGHPHDCGLCPICHVLAAAALPAAGVAVAAVTVDRQPPSGQPPPATGPPQAPRAAARPRAPPRSV